MCERKQKAQVGEDIYFKIAEPKNISEETTIEGTVIAIIPCHVDVFKYVVVSEPNSYIVGEYQISRNNSTDISYEGAKVHGF